MRTLPGRRKLPRTVPVCWLALTFMAACAGTPSPEFQNTFATKEAAARAVLDAFWQRDPDRLTSLAVSEAEFRKYVWPQLPATQAGVGGSADYWWEDLQTRSLASMAQLLEDYGGRRLELESMTFKGDPTDYGTFFVHHDAHLSVRDADGNALEVRVFGSLVETPTGWKVYSYVID